MFTPVLIHKIWNFMYLWFITFFNNINFCFARPSPHPGTSLDRLNSMSPAARRLASTQLRRRIGSDLALQASYSPSPHSIRSGQASPSLAKTPTPGKNGRMKKNRLSTPNLNITDNLLNLPTRPRASDFF
jgi:protein DGCR14